MDQRLLRILNNREQNYPHALDKQFPRILAKIMALWDTPDMNQFFVELMVNKRGDRAGFPKDVASDIIYLSMVHARQGDQPEQSDAWSGIPETVRQEIMQQGLTCDAKGFIKAAESGRSGVVALFLSAGVNVDTCDERLWTPLMISAFNGNEEMAILLVRSGANIHHRDVNGYTPLHWAAFNGFLRVAELLLNKHAEVDARSNHAWTPLLQAATKGQLTTCSLLLEYGADANAAADDGWTPLLKAAANGHFAVAMLLLSKGADVKLKYRDGSSALDLAQKNKHDEIANILAARS